ncbi:MAG: hypothetical protein ABJ084_05140 [Halioglobus sp.]
MNWDAIGATAEALGAIAVFLSLIYLAIQTKNNTRALRSAAFHQVRDSFADVSLALCQDPSLTRLVTRAMENDPELAKEEIAQFEFFLTTFVRRGESAYFQSTEGALQMEAWNGIREGISIVLSNVYSQTWWESTRGRFTSEYTEELQQAIASRQSA